MTAADKKIILEHGSDYILQLKIKDDDGINNRNMSNWTWTFDVYSKAGVIIPTHTSTGVIPANDDSVNGEVTVLIDSAKIDTIPTAIAGDDAFATQFNYYYTLTVVQPGTPSTSVRAMRLIRGKLAVRL